MGYIRQSIHLLPDNWTAPAGLRAWREDWLQPLSWNLRPLRRAPCTLFGFVCYCLPTKQHSYLLSPSLPGEPASSPCLSYLPFSEGVEARPTAADPKTLSAALLGGANTTRVSPRIWETADLKIVHVHVTGMEELRVAEFLALRQKINVHDSPHLSKKKTKNKRRRIFHLPSCNRPGLVGFCGRSRSRCPCAPNPGSAAGACWSGRLRSGWTGWGAFCAHSVQNSCIHIHQAEAAGAVRPGAGGQVVALRAASKQPEPGPEARRSQAWDWLRGWVTFSLKESRGSAGCAVQHRFH